MSRVNVSVTINSGYRSEDGRARPATVSLEGDQILIRCGLIGGFRGPLVELEAAIRTLKNAAHYAREGDEPEVEA